MVHRPFVFRLALGAFVALVVVRLAWGRTGRDVSLEVGAHRFGACVDGGGVALGYGYSHRPVPVDGVRPAWNWGGAAGSDGNVSFVGFEGGTVGVVRAVPVLGSIPALGQLFGVSEPAHFVKAPWWALFGVTGLVPLARMVGLVRASRRQARGLCAACGYDLRASPQGCPECGAQFPNASR
jgi:hypothetical protein